MAWADLRRRQEGVERAERAGGRQEEGRGREGTQLVQFRQPAIPPEQEGEMQQRAWRRIRGEAARLAERGREVAARERRVRDEEEAEARGAHRVLPDPEVDTPSTDVEYAPRPVRRGPGTVAGWTAGEVAELVRYAKWAGKTRGRRERRGTHPFGDLVGRAGKPRERRPEMHEARWRRMLGEALPGVRLDCPQEKGKKPRVQMLRELLQRDGRYGGDA